MRKIEHSTYRIWNELFQNALRFWLDKGIDGFRMDAIIFMGEDENMEGNDEPVATDGVTDDPTQYAYLNHTLTIDQPLTYQRLREFRQVLEEYPEKKLSLIYGFKSFNSFFS